MQHYSILLYSAGLRIQTYNLASQGVFQRTFFALHRKTKRWSTKWTEVCSTQHSRESIVWLYRTETKIPRLKILNRKWGHLKRLSSKCLLVLPRLAWYVENFWKKLDLWKDGHSSTFCHYIRMHTIHLFELSTGNRFLPSLKLICPLLEICTALENCTTSYTES